MLRTGAHQLTSSDESFERVMKGEGPLHSPHSQHASFLKVTVQQLYT